MAKEEKFRFSKKQARALHYQPDSPVLPYGIGTSQKDFSKNELYVGRVLRYNKKEMVVHCGKGCPIVMVRNHHKLSSIGSLVLFEVHGIYGNVARGNFV